MIWYGALMKWPTPQFTRKKVTRAGEILSSPSSSQSDRASALEVVNNWRSCHGYPINTFQATLRLKLKKIDPQAIVAQRLKRLPSIVEKLKRFESMQLARMQDIGGLRAVVASLPKARELEQSYRSSGFRHELADSRDYILSPKKSGYRSIHLVYRYNNPSAPDYNNLLVELQIRTRLQHAWATAVETMGTFLNHALKSSEGPEEWLEFFALCGSAFAHLEDMPPVPGYEKLNKLENYRAVALKARELEVEDRLRAFTVAVDSITRDNKPGTYHLLILYPETKTVQVFTYGQARLAEATDHYAKVEERLTSGEPIQAVLVAAGPVKNLRNAYPNYFLDTEQFLRHLKKIRRSVPTSETRRS